MLGSLPRGRPPVSRRQTWRVARSGGLDLRAEILGCDLLKESSVKVTRVINKNVDPAEPLDGSAGGVLLKAPKGLDVRPTPDLVRQAVFNSLGARVEGARVLELQCTECLVTDAQGKVWPYQ